jgi:hypothetical protein
MRKINFMPVSVLLAVALFASCSSSVSDLTDQDVPGKEILVSFNVSKLNVSSEDMDQSTTAKKAPHLVSRAATESQDPKPISEVLKKIGYRITGTSNKSGSVSYDPQTESAPDDFGKLQISLLPGENSLLFYGIGKDSQGSFTLSESDGHNIYEGSNTELFVYQDRVTVSSSQKDFEVPLQRKSAQIVIQITDAVPAQVAKVKYSVTVPSKYDEYNGIYKNQVTDELYPTIANSKLQDLQYNVTLPHNAATLQIDVIGTDGSSLGSTTLSVPVYQNRRSIVSGELFSLIGDKQLSVTVDDTWGDDVTVPLK